MDRTSAMFVKERKTLQAMITKHPVPAVRHLVHGTPGRRAGQTK